jgi:hypothetical protein
MRAVGTGPPAALDLFKVMIFGIAMLPGDETVVVMVIGTTLDNFVQHQIHV